MKPAQWTGKIIGEIHNEGLTLKEVAVEAGLNPKYVSQVLNADKESPSAERKLRDALQRLVELKTEKGD